MDIKTALSEAKIDNLDAQLLLMEVTGLSKVELITKDCQELNENQIEYYKELVKRRENHEPIQYILNKTEFMGLNFYVDKNVLIPRADTELLVEEALFYIENKNLKTAIDLCAGSGCIGISVAKLSGIEKMTCVDISQEALAIAQKNAISNGVEQKINFTKSDMFTDIRSNKKEVDILLSNPPYIETEIIKTLENNVKNYEPKLALDGKDDGLYFYRIIAKNAKDYLTDEGIIILEIGYNQKKSIEKLFENYDDIIIKKDYAGLDRIAIIRKKA